MISRLFFILIYFSLLSDLKHAFSVIATRGRQPVFSVEVYVFLCRLLRPQSKGTHVSACLLSRKPLGFQDVGAHLEGLLSAGEAAEDARDRPVEGRLGPQPVVLDHTSGFEGLLFVDDDLLGVSSPPGPVRSEGRPPSSGQRSSGLRWGGGVSLCRNQQLALCPFARLCFHRRLFFALGARETS
ncbi:E3 ubiquitin-protein ligase RNF123 [Liparis tanakae]|uniref:E3 ubiquitin-protein ligase RNF123 n=1 Tax=Liparis tanakae TaxID=230148 RepID=A0A4Z2E284_9TELE|nr:E3 ubiquitin-protein ligase RNF123 [Liparis tanakae]